MPYLNYEDCEIYKNGNYDLYVIFKKQTPSSVSDGVDYIVNTNITTKKPYITIGTNDRIYFCNIGEIVGIYGSSSKFYFYKNGSNQATKLSYNEVSSLPSCTTYQGYANCKILDSRYIISTPDVPFKNSIYVKTSTDFNRYNATSLTKQKGLMPSIYTKNYNLFTSNVRYAPTTAAFKKGNSYILKRSEVIENVRSTLLSKRLLDIFIETLKINITSDSLDYFYKYFESVYSADDTSFKNTNDITILLKDGSTRNFSFGIKFRSKTPSDNKDLINIWYEDNYNTILLDHRHIFRCMFLMLFITYDCFGFTNRTDFVEYNVERKQYLTQLLNVNPDNIADIYFNLTIK